MYLLVTMVEVMVMNGREEPLGGLSSVTNAKPCSNWMGSSLLEICEFFIRRSRLVYEVYYTRQERDIRANAVVHNQHRRRSHGAHPQLVAAGINASLFPNCDIVTTITH